MGLNLAAQGGASAARDVDFSALDPAVFRAFAVGYGVLLALGLASNVWIAWQLAIQPQRWPAREARVMRRLLPGADVLHLVFYLVTCFGVGAGLQIGLSGWIGDGLSDGWLMALHSLSFHWAALLGVNWLLASRHATWRTTFGLKRPTALRDVGMGLFGYVAMVPLFLFMSALYHFALRAVGYDVNLQEVARLITDEPSRVAKAYLYLVALLLAPAVEELLFRGIALPFLVRRVGVGPAVFLVSLVFALIHFHVPSVVPLFVVSLALCVAYVHSGSILVPMVMHALFNGVNLWMLSMLR